MPNKGEDLYGTNGSVPDNVAVNGSGAHEMSVHADPNAFGAGVGQALSNASSQAQETVQKYQGMINETLATNADAGLSEQIGAIKGKFKSMTGLEAVNAQQETIAQMNKAFQSARANLPPMAAQGFDSMAKRSLGYALGEVNEYGASQIKSANTNSHGQTAMMAALSSKDPSIAMSDDQFNNKLGDIKWASASMLDPDHPGLSKDEDGMVNGFKDNDAGNALRSIHQNTIDHYTGLAWQNRFDALSDQDPIAAADKFSEEKWRIPPLSAVDIQSKLEPQVTFAKGNQASQFTIVKASQDHAEMVLNPPSNGPNPYNLGNVKTKEGSINNTQEFLNPATPVDGVISTANTLRSGYNGMSLSQIAPKWTGEPDKAAVWASNAASASGLDPESKLDLNDPATLGALLKGVAAAEKSPKDRSAFTDDVISQGVQSSLSGTEAKTLPPLPPKTYYTNPDGSKFTDADYLATHKEELLQKVADISEKNWPGDMASANKARELMNQHIETSIQNQSANYRKDNMDIMRAISGDLSKGKPPSTENELRQLPGMADLLKRVPVQDPKFYESIPTLIAKAQRTDDKENSPNGYETIQRVLQPYDHNHPNGIYSQDQLDRLMGRSDDTGINHKDYKDAKGAIDLGDNLKSTISKNMDSIKNNGGNIDGYGQQRAINFYTQAMKLIQDNQTKGDKSLSEGEIIKQINESNVPHMPDRQAQLSNIAPRISQNSIPSFSSPNDGGFSDLPSGSQFMTPGGQIRIKK